MRIERIEVYGYELTYAHGSYVMSGGQVVRGRDHAAARPLRLEHSDFPYVWPNI